MDTKGKYENKFHRICLACDAFTTGCLVMCLLVLAPYAATFAGTLVIWFLPIACLIPFILMPLFYNMVHRVDTLLFGRYHLAMPVSAFTAALFFVMGWSATSDSPSQVCLVFFGSTVFVTAITVYRYCSFSVRARLSGSGLVSRTSQYEIIGALGSCTAIGAFVGFLHYDPTTAYINTAYVLSCVCVLSAIVQYLATCYGIPILGGKRVQAVKSVFGTFYGGLDKKTYFSALLFESAYAAVAALVVYFGFTLGVGMYKTMIVAGTLVAVYALVACICTRWVRHRSMVLSVVNLLCMVTAAGILIVVAALDGGGNELFACLIVSATDIGCGGAVAVRQTKLRFLTIKPHITVGTVYILLELTMLASAAIAFLTAAVVTAAVGATHSTAAFIYGFASAVVLCAVAFALAGKKTVKTESVPELGDPEPADMHGDLAECDTENM